MALNTIKAALNKIALKLSSVSETPFFDAEILMTHALGLKRSGLHAWPLKTIDPLQYHSLMQLVERRAAGEPIAYITGTREFWSIPLHVTSHTLIPRPETELLVDYLINDKHLNQSACLKIADLGTGSGAIAIALAKERPHWQLAATDISHQALEIARKNAKQEAISFYQGHWVQALPEVDFDIIVSNPPYISESEWSDYSAGLAFEPRTALVSGQDGLDAIREISSQGRYYLKTGGLLLVEHGFLQGASVREILTHDGYDSVGSLLDLGRRERATYGYLR